MPSSTRCRTAVLLTAFVVLPAIVYAQSVTATWSPSPPSENVTGYDVCVGTSSGSCNVQTASVPSPQVSVPITPAGGVLNYVAVRASNANGAGPYSSPVAFSIPSLAQPSNQTNPVGAAIAPLTLAVSDPDGSALTFTHTGLPVGLSINSSTRQITGTPAAAGVFNVTLFVSDGLVSVSRSFVWTITSPDTTPPSLAILSHANGQTVTSGTVTISGTATDGVGGSGITSVTVNTQPATGGTATGGGTANWSRAITLSSGSNTITVRATDGAGNVTTQQITLTLSIPAVTNAMIAANRASPQNTGTAITLTGAGTGGVTPYQYKFLLQQGTGTAQTVRNWSTTANYTWTPTAAAGYTITVWVRSAGITVDAPQASAQMTYSIVTPSVSAVSATPASGSGSTQAFSLQYADSAGAANLTQGWVWITGSLGTSAANSCLLYYDRPSARLYLLDDSGGTWMPGTLGSAATLQNAQCAASLAGSSVSLSGATMTLNLAMTFASGFAGAKNVYMFARNASINSGWQDRGDWTVPTTTSPPPPPPPPPSAAVVTVVGVTPASGSGSSQTFSLQYADSAGATNLTQAWVWINASFGTNAANTCLLYYDRPSARLYLLDNGGSVWMPGTLGSAATIQNSQCAVALAGSSVSLSGTTLTLNLVMGFSPGFAGAKNVYLYARNANINSGWQDRGDWIVTSGGQAPPPPPAEGGVTANSVTPGSGSGNSQTFALQYADSTGATNLTQAWVWVNPSFSTSAANSCLLYYDRPSARVYLLNDSGSVWMPGTLGGGTTLQNSHCTVSLAGSSVSLSGTTLTLNLAMTFRSGLEGFSGAKNVYMYARNAGGANSGWQDRGDWVVP